MQIKDEKNNFRAENFKIMARLLQAEGQKRRRQLQRRRGATLAGAEAVGGGEGGAGGGRSGPSGRQDTEKVSNDIVKILKMVKQKKLEPVICFSFARRSVPLYLSSVGSSRRAS